MRLNYKWMIILHGIITSFVSSIFFSFNHPNEISPRLLIGSFIILSSTMAWLQYAYGKVDKIIDKLIVVIAVGSPMIIGYLNSTLREVIISVVLTTALMSLLVLTEKMD